MDNEKEGMELNEEQLEKVSGGAVPAEEIDAQKYQDFKNAWDALGLAGNNMGIDLETEYRRWKQSGYIGSAFDFLLPLTK